MSPPIQLVPNRSPARIPLWATAIAVLLLSPAGWLRAEQQLLFDFERPGLSNEWSAIRKIQVARQPVPAATEQNGIVPAGHGVKVSTPGSAGVYAKSGKVPRDWRRFESVSLWVYRSPEETRQRPASTMELQVYESDGKARFWRRVDLVHVGWAKVEVPLRWFRYGNQRIPRWDRVDRFGLWFRDGADVTVDAIALTVGETDVASELTAVELAATGFPDSPEDAVRTAEDGHIRVLTNASDLDLAKLRQQLAAVAKRVRRDLALADDSIAPATLIVFATRDQFQAFPTRFARKMNSEGYVPPGSGFTTHGVSTSYWDAQLGTLRPVYTHEFVHSLVSHAVFLPNRGEWFHEGLATYYQLQFHPQKNLANIVNNGLEEEGARLPLPRLLDGQPIPMNRYWQALTVIEMLLGDDKYRSRFPALVTAFQQAGSTDVGPHLDPVLKTDWETFSRDWEKHCRKTYGAAKGGQN